MVFNDTKVVPARLHFKRETGAHIEIFCLEPVLPEEYVTMFEVTDRCRWKCIVGNVKRWKSDTLFLFNPENDSTVAEMGLKADLVERRGETSIVEFSWANGAPFSKVLEICGSIPIPPYLNRDNLYVAEVYANQGPTLKRFRPRAKGSAAPILKRSSHITVILDEKKEDK